MGIGSEAVALQISFGQVVYDRVGHTVGSVAQVDRDARWLKVGHRIFSPQDLDLYLPFDAITSIDPRAIRLALDRDVLQRDYSTLRPHGEAHPPQGPEVPETPAAVPELSGHQRRPMHRAPAHGSALPITPGMQVSLVLGAPVGMIRRYEPAAGWILVEKQRITPRDLYLPSALVDSVSRATATVFLATTKEDLARLALSGAAIHAATAP